MNRKLNLTFGLLIGAMWMGQILFGNLGDTAVLGNLRTYHFQVWRSVVWCFVWGALLFTVCAGLFGAYKTGNIQKGLALGFWSGLISGGIAGATVILVTVIFNDALVVAPATIHEFTRSGQLVNSTAELSRLLYWDALGGGVNHIWIGALLGVTLGGVGAVLGRGLQRSLAHSR